MIAYHLPDANPIFPFIYLSNSLYICMALVTPTRAADDLSYNLMSAIEEEYVPAETIFLRPEEFADEAETKLGRANGNTYRRKPATDSHDGQIMVRLKKKRFIIIDYGYVPKPQDYDLCKTVPHIMIPNGAGQKQCATNDCCRIGVPVLLYDSEPNEPTSLYLRGGLCFSCQRNLNEKRRTQRKRKSDGHPVGEVRVGNAPSILSYGSVNRYRFNDQIVELNPDAVVINGPVEGTRSRGPTYRYTEIGSDLLRIVSELSQQTLALMQHSSGVHAGMVPTPESINHQYQLAFQSASRATYLLTQWKASYDQQMQQQMLGPNQPRPVHPSPMPTNSGVFNSQAMNEAVAAQSMQMQAAYAAAYPQHLLQAAAQGGFNPHHPGSAFGGGMAMQSLMMPAGTMQNMQNTAGMQNMQNIAMQNNVHDESSQDSQSNVQV